MKLRERSAAQITQGKCQEKTKKREESSKKKSLRKEAPPTNVEESTMDEADEKEYDVEKVLAFRESHRKGREFKILWTGYPFSAATWEPEANLDNARKLVDEFLLGKQRPALMDNHLADSSSIRTREKRKTPMKSGSSFEISTKQEGNSQNAKMTDVKKTKENVMAIKGNNAKKTKDEGKMKTMDFISPPPNRNRLLSQLKSIQPLFTSTPIEKGPTSSIKGNNAKKTKDEGKMTPMDFISPPPNRNRAKNLVLDDNELDLEDNDLLSNLKSIQPFFTSTPNEKRSYIFT